MQGAGLSRRSSERHRLESQPSSRTGENPPYGMIGGIEETSASFEARSAPRSYPIPIRYGRLSHRKAELECTSPWMRAPQAGSLAHSPDQCPQIRADRGPASQGARLPAPVASKPGTVPPFQRLGPDNQRCLEDRREPAIEPDEEQAIAVVDRLSAASWPPSRRAAPPCSAGMSSNARTAARYASPTIPAAIATVPQGATIVLASGWRSGFG